MKHTIFIDQLTLEHWKEKIDTIDAVIISFIQSLDPKNPAIKSLMWRGYFLITRKFLLEQCPILGPVDPPDPKKNEEKWPRRTITRQALYRRLRKLRELGLLCVIHRTITGNKQLAYFKLSDAFWKVNNARHKAATDAAKKETSASSEAVVSRDHGPKAVIPGDYGSAKNHSICVPEPSSPETSNEFIKNSLRETSPESPLLNGAPPDDSGKEPGPTDVAQVVEILGDFKRNHINHHLDVPDEPDPDDGWEIIDEDPDQPEPEEDDSEWPEAEDDLSAEAAETEPAVAEPPEGAA